MAQIRSINDIILSLLDYFKLAQPDLCLNSGSVAKNCFVDAPASQLALLYEELASISNKQSLRLVVGSELDNLARNFGIVRKQPTPSTGVALLTFASIDAPIAINQGNIIIANNGFSFSVSSGLTVSPTASNFYRSVASKYRDQLDTVGINDQYAIEVTVIASSSGTAGNIGKYTLSRTTISGVSNVTNINSFSGGTDQEDDGTFRNRVLASFSGSSVGTALGYLNAALATPGVSDSIVIEPGDPLMTRDGTQVSIAPDGTRTIISEGSGGKVDVIILGTNLTETFDSYIYKDKSNNNDPTNSKNNIVLGQISGDENKTVNRKRIDNIKSGVLPSQPIDSISQVSGSLSGSNFQAKTTDIYGRVSGNYEIIKDTGVYSGSPWGFDTFHWISNKISLFSEDKTKGQFNGQDATTFTDVINIPDVQQSISITNENSTVTYDRSIIQLLHTPASNVTRVYNVKTGERYIIVNQNYDNTGLYNTTGRIQISGNTLPSPSDILQVDYNWIVNFDQYSDYDGLNYTSNQRSSINSIDWGYSSLVKNEKITFSKDLTNNFFVGTVSHPISSIIEAKLFLEIDGTVELLVSGQYSGYLAVNLTYLSDLTTSVNSITLKNNNTELYLTSQNNGVIINQIVVVGSTTLYNTTIVLPTDSTAVVGNKVSVILNEEDVYQSSTNNGSFTNNEITIPSDLIDTTANEIALRVSYIANIPDLFSEGITSLSASRCGSGYVLSNNVGFTNFSIVNNIRKEHLIIQQNLSSQYYVELNLSSNEFTLNEKQIIGVFRVSDGANLFENSSSYIDISAGIEENYQLILTKNTPVLGQTILVVYYADDIRRFQPFSFSNNLIKSRLDQILSYGSDKILYLNNFVAQGSGLNFDIIEPNTDIELLNITDGVLTVNLDGSATLVSATADFSTIPDILNKKVIIKNATNDNNNGLYDITSLTLPGTIKVQNIYTNITKDQICVINLSDGKEIWNYNGLIDTSTNKITLPTTSASVGSKVISLFFNYSNIRKSPTKLNANILDQILNTGVISINGTTLYKAEDVVFTATNTSLKVDIQEALSKVSAPSNAKLIKVIKLEKVSTLGLNNDEVLTVDATFDTKCSSISNTLYYSDEMIYNNSLYDYEFILSNTDNNINNTPNIGDKLRITFYYIIENDNEYLSYTKNGTLYTNKNFALINKISVSSGFKSSLSTRLLLSSFTQPSTSSKYTVYYDYLAPKQNERITIRYNYNKLIGDTTFSIEDVRPINADVLVKSATKVLLDLSINVVISDSYKSSETSVLQNLRDKLSAAMNINILGQIIDVPTLVNVAQAVAGVDRARVIYFNKNGASGTTNSIQGQKNEYFASNNIVINTETR